jgi:diaminopimelate epimerase
LRPPSSPDIFDFRMDVFNADGSKAEQCANGLRCVAKYFTDAHPLHSNISTSSRLIDIETAAGHVKATVSLTSLSLWKYALNRLNSFFIRSQILILVVVFLRVALPRFRPTSASPRASQTMILSWK